MLYIGRQGALCGNVCGKSFFALEQAIVVARHKVTVNLLHWTAAEAQRKAQADCTGRLGITRA